MPAPSSDRPQQVRIALGERSYDIQIGAGLLGQPATWERLPSAASALVVTNTTVGPLYAERLLTSFGLERATSRMERLGEAVPGGIDIGVRPEDVEDLFAVQGVTRNRGQELREALGASPLPREVGHRKPVSLDCESTQQTHVEDGDSAGRLASAG